MAGIWIYSEETTVAAELAAMAQDLAKTMQRTICGIALTDAMAQNLVENGVEKIFRLESDSQHAESYVKAIVELAKAEQPEVLLIGATMRGKSMAAQIAAGMQAGLVTEATKVSAQDNGIETERMLYGGLAVCTEQLAFPVLVTIPAHAYEARKNTDGPKGEILGKKVQTDQRIKVEEVCPIISQGADVSAAERLICVGRGIGKQEDMELAEALAKICRAEIGCTRSIAEDYHWLPSESYIGLSGKTTKPDLYISLGVSGQVQHVAGIRDSKVIVAIDMNENAPIFAAADYGIVGDLYEIVPALTQALEQAKK